MFTIGGRAAKEKAPDWGLPPYDCMRTPCELCGDGNDELSCSWKGSEVSREGMWEGWSPASRPLDRWLMPCIPMLCMLCTPSALLCG